MWPAVVRILPAYGRTPLRVGGAGPGRLAGTGVEHLGHRDSLPAMASADFPWRSSVTPGIRAEHAPRPDAPAEAPAQPEPAQADHPAAPPGAAPGAVPADQGADGPALPDAEQYRSLLAAAAQVLDRVDRALGQLADGSYGRCSECGSPIEHGVLERDPMADRCAAHATGSSL